MSNQKDNQGNLTTTEDTKKHNDIGMVTAVKEKIGGGIGDMIDCSRFELLQKLLFCSTVCFKFEDQANGVSGIIGKSVVGEDGKSEVL